MLHVVCEIFIWLLGLCVGSFLNVVVYRLPHGLSIANPPRSFCPRCRVGITWYDNIPLLSWLLLGGRCRNCRQRISVQYPLVEGLTGLAFVLVYHLIFVAQTPAELLALRVPQDVPLLLAWLVLVAGLVVCAAMDIVSYSVDVRVTNAVVLAAIVLRALWPRAESIVPRAGTPTAAATLAAFLVSGVMLWLTVWRVPAPEEGGEVESTEDQPSAAEAPAAGVAGRLSVLVLVLLAAWFVYPALHAEAATAWPPVIAALLAAFAVVVVIGGQRRSADAEIHAAIEEEQPQARLTAVKELAWLAPAIVVGAVALVAVGYWPALGAAWRRVVAWSPGGDFVPLGGALTAIHGAIIGAAAGWVLRVVFTLVFGREAFGVGDIYILAAAGAAGGWDIALLGLLFSIGIALAGWMLGLLLKSTVMIPFGPWLALGFLVALWWHRPAQRIAAAYRDNVVVAWEEQPHVLLVAGGLMLVGTAAAIVFSRLVRRWVVPD